MKFKKIISRFFLFTAGTCLLMNQTACVTVHKTYVMQGAKSNVDPVCGTKVNLDTALLYEYNGQTYYFDTEECRTVFQKNPEKFVVREMPMRQQQDQGMMHGGWWGAVMVGIMAITMTSVMIFGHW